MQYDQALGVKGNWRRRCLHDPGADTYPFWSEACGVPRREIVIKHLPFPAVGFGDSNQPGFLTAIHMDNNQHRGRWEHAHAAFAYFAVIFTFIDFREDGSVKDVCGFLEAAAMLRLIFYILVRILFIAHRLYIICICETQEKPYIKGREVPRFSGCENDSQDTRKRI